MSETKKRILNARNIGMAFISLIFTAIIASFSLHKETEVGPVPPLRVWEAK